MNAYSTSSPSFSGSPILSKLRPHSRRSPVTSVAPVCVVVAPTQKGYERPFREDVGKSTALSVSQHHQSSTTWLWETTCSLAGSIVGALRFDRYLRSGEPASEKQAKTNLLGETTKRAVQAGTAQQAEDAGVKAPPVNILKFLHRVGIMEIRYIRMLASLCSLTYAMHRATERSLFRLHGLRLVTTSLRYERMTKEPPRTVSQAFEEADGMAASPQLVAGAYHDILKSSENQVPAMQAIERLKETEPLEKMPTPAEVVAARITSAASAAASAAAPLASNISSAAVGITAAPLQVIGSQLQTAASIGQSTALATIATVTAALESVWGQREVTKKQAISSSYWFVADDEKAHTRFFVIQGSNNIDHWRINLQFDPVTFEDPALGLKVHRGFYEAAKVLYDQFLPLVEQHLSSSPFSKIVFTGHSLGGGVGSLLMLMFLHRKVIPPLALGPAYTFGAPGVFCETNIAGLPRHEGQASVSAADGFLEQMGLNAGAIRNVMMHRDLVPRAFSCDYTLVADLLARVSDSFKNLESLRNKARRVMYYTLGRTLLLQPDEAQGFVFGGADHPMLPPGPNLFTLREPWSINGAADQINRRLSNNIQPAAAFSGQARAAAVENERLNNIAATLLSSRGGDSRPEPRRTGEANLDEDGTNIDDSGPDKAGRSSLGPAAASVPEAIAAFMDTPHPLDILSEPGSYGFTGAISRYHDPVHYVKALGGVLRSRTRPWRKVPGGGGGASSVELPRLHHIEAPLKRSRKVRNAPQSTASEWNKLATAAR